MSTADGSVTVIPNVRNFRIAARSSRHVVYHLVPRDTTGGPQSGDTVTAAAAVPGQQPRAVAAGDTGRRTAPRKEYGTTLVIRELATGSEARISDVSAYHLDDRGERLVYTVTSRDEETDGVFVRTLATAAVTALLSGAGTYRALVLDHPGAQVAFLAERHASGGTDTTRAPRLSLYHARLGASAALELLPASRLGDTLVIPERARIRFSDDGRALLFAVAAPLPDSIPAELLADKAVLDLWHWRDPRLQPQQRIEASRDRTRGYSAILHLGARRFLVLGNDTTPTLSFSRDGRWGLAVSETPYAIEAMWGQGGSDVVLFDARTGARRLVAQRVPFGAELSPDGNYVMYFGDDGSWYAYATQTGRTENVSGRITGVRFDRETWDTPGIPAPWGIAGWTHGDRSVLLYDKYDVWEADPAGQRPARMVTDSLGRRENIVFRVVQLDTAARAFDPAQPLLLRATHDSTKASGFWSDRLGVVAPPVRLIMADRRLDTPTRARDADVLVYTSSTFREFPDLWTSDGDFRNQVRLSNVNPQQADYRWGTAEPVRWRSLDGIPLSGILFKPDGFDPTQKYPMVVYFYEQLSQNLHNYVMTMPRNTIQPTHYVSHGYLVFFPDIAYQEGYPGASALKSIVPGVQMLVDRGFVDPNGIGIAGQSWGGYQTAYIITQTDIFRAAFAGAPVANMTSAYGGIRWSSGLARPFQYERTQSRIGGSLWEYPLRYIENSPLFMADRVRTPLLMMHNDNDGAVPWYQGIEMFIALRRLQREAYLINYNGDEHNPTKRANQADMAARMMQFFDHHLRGEPMPEWMEKGIPFLQKGRDQLQLATPAIAEEERAVTPAGGGG